MSQDQIRAWLKRHPEALPQTVDDLDRFPMAFRRVMVAMVAPEVRLRLRREHLETFLAPESPLTSDQRTFVLTTIPELPLESAPDPIGQLEIHMAKSTGHRGADHHRQAAAHFASAAEHHRNAAEHHDADQHSLAGHHAHIAFGHYQQAVEHASEAAKHYGMMAGKSRKKTAGK